MKTKFGNYLRHLRHDRKLTLSEASEKASMSTTYLSQLERGERALPTIKTLFRIAKAYGIQVEILTQEAFKEIPNADFIIGGQAIEMKRYRPNQRPPAATPDFILRTYEKLSPEKQRTFQEYLLFLVDQDKTKK